MRTILLTGATGFLGSNLLKPLLEKGYFVIVLKRSFSNIDRINKLLNNYKKQIALFDLDSTKLDNVFNNYNIDIMIHCATNYGRDNDNILEIIQSNLLLPLELLHLGIVNNVNNFINTDTVIDKNINHYSLSKKQFLDWLHKYSPQIKCINLSLEYFYGAFDNDTKFTTYIIKQLLNQAPEIDLTKGEQRRYFIYIDDVVSAFLTILDNLNKIDSGFSSFEVSTKRNISIKNFVLLVKKISENNNTKLNFGKVPYRKNELMNCKTDTSKLEALGWKAKTSLEEGITKTIIQEKNI